MLRVQRVNVSTGRSLIMPFGIALAGGAWIFGLFLIVFLFAVAHGLYSKSGSAINQRAWQGTYGDAPGSKIPSTIGNDRVAAQRYTRGTR